jgi:hypothetical protein
MPAWTFLVPLPFLVAGFRARADVSSNDDPAAGPADSPETVPIVYVEADGTEKAVEAEVGMNLMDVAHAHNVELEGTSDVHGIMLACTSHRTASEAEEEEIAERFEHDTYRFGCRS